MNPHVNIESLTEMKRLVEDAKVMIDKLRSEPLPKDLWDVLDSGWLGEGSKGFTDLTSVVSVSDLKHWHTRVVKLDVAIMALKSAHQRSVDLFANSYLSKTQRVLTKPVRQLEWLLRNEGKLITLFLAAEDIAFYSIQQFCKAMDNQADYNDIVASQIRITDGLGASLRYQFFATAGQIPAAMERMDEALERAKKAFISIVTPYLELLMYQSLYEVLIAFVSLESMKKFYVPLHRRRDEAQNLILESMLPQDSRRFGSQQTKKGVTTRSDAKPVAFSVPKWMAHRWPPKGDIRFKRRRRSSRGKTRLVDVLLPARRGPKSKAEKALLAKKNAAEALYRRGLRKKATLAKLAALRKEAKPLTEKYIATLKGSAKEAARYEKRQLKKSISAMRDQLRGETRRTRFEIAELLRARASVDDIKAKLQSKGLRTIRGLQGQAYTDARREHDDLTTQLAEAEKAARGLKKKWSPDGIETRRKHYFQQSAKQREGIKADLRTLAAPLP